MWVRSFLCLLFFCFISVRAFGYQSLARILSEPTFDLDGFVQSLNSSDKNSLESTLLNLKKEQPSFFKNYVLMYKSRSLQTSSFLYPRVLLNSPNSTTILSYNGHPQDHGYEKLEVMRFDTEKFEFIFNELSFQDGEIALSQNNPQKCMNCHQNSSRVKNDPRPNWEPYSIWPGAYASSSVDPGELSDPTSPKYDLVLAHDAALENEMYQLFLDSIMPQHPRYKLLAPMVLSKLGKYFPALGVPKDSPNFFTIRITDQLLNLNALRIARLIKESSVANDYKKVIFALARCEKIYLPPQILAWHQKYAQNGVQEDVKTGQFAEAVEFIFEPYQISTQDWSMDFGTGGKFAFRHRFGGPNLFRNALREALQIVMPSLKGYSCQNLEKELKASKFVQTQRLRELIDESLEPAPSVSLIQNCISCHTTSAFGAPYIPFDDPVQLSRALKEEGYPRGRLVDEILYRTGPHALFFERMPANGYLPQPAELEGFVDYIKSL